MASVALALISIVRLPVPLALCTAPDGHRAIEPMYASCCHDDARGGDDCCGDGCTDTPLSGDPTIRSAEPQQGQIAVAAAMPAPIAAAAVLGTTGRVAAVERRGPPPPLRHHTTVIIC